MSTTSIYRKKERLDLDLNVMCDGHHIFFLNTQGGSSLVYILSNDKNKVEI